MGFPNVLYTLFTRHFQPFNFSSSSPVFLTFPGLSLVVKSLQSMISLFGVLAEFL